jgi:hypothetical protein
VDPTVARINDLESAVEQKIAELDSKISSLEGKVEKKLEVFESLLKKIALHLNVPDE